MPARIKKNHRPQKKQPGSFRVIGGEWRSRRLYFPVVDGLRPTTDRVRETLFNWLSSRLPAAKVVDLFSGSGALGLEALSRGAISLVAIERDREVSLALKENLKLLKFSGEAVVVNTDAIQWLESGQINDVDILFLDPPFRTDLLDRALICLEKLSALKAGTLVYLEVEKEKKGLSIPVNWTLIKEKQAGQVSYRLYEVIGDKE